MIERILSDVANQLAHAQAFQLTGGRVVTVNNHGTSVNELSCTYGAPKRGLATSVLPHQGNNLSRSDVEGHSVYHSGAVVGNRHPMQVDHVTPLKSKPMQDTKKGGSEEPPSYAASKVA